jgi:hypothetical protein
LAVVAKAGVDVDLEQIINDELAKLDERTSTEQERHLNEDKEFESQVEKNEEPSQLSKGPEVNASLHYSENAFEDEDSTHKMED